VCYLVIFIIKKLQRRRRRRLKYSGASSFLIPFPREEIIILSSIQLFLSSNQSIQFQTDIVYILGVKWKLINDYIYIMHAWWWSYDIIDSRLIVIFVRFCVEVPISSSTPGPLELEGLPFCCRSVSQGKKLNEWANDWTSFELVTIVIVKWVCFACICVTVSVNVIMNLICFKYIIYIYII